MRRDVELASHRAGASEGVPFGGEKPENSPGELANRLSRGKKWGILPPKIREAIGSVNPKTAPSEYLEIIRSYYRRISEQYAERKK